MATNISSTALDFEDIKSRLKTYLQAQDQFRDYDFEASGINNILDVLAYNTHFNGLIANFSLNESFLNTAQLRSSVVSHAEALGYRPKSVTASKGLLSAYLDLSSMSNRPSTVKLPIGTKFRAVGQDDEAQDTDYEFKTRQNYYAYDDGNGIYRFLDDDGNYRIEVFEGVSKTKTFIVDNVAEDEVYVIPDAKMDTSSVSIDVYKNPTSDDYETYYDLLTAIVVDDTTRFFDIKEAPNGYYEINFGDGVSFGKKPSVGEKIVVKYTAANGSAANGANDFASLDTLVVNSSIVDILISTQTPSSSGAEKETIESIRKLAPIQFAAQQRLVTPLDYKGMILSNFTDVTDVTVWGGEDNLPVDYGRVYISMQFKDGLANVTKDQIKQNIESKFTDRLSIMSISNKFVDPVDTFIELSVAFNYNPELTGKSLSEIKSVVEAYIKNYFNNNFNKFQQTFRKSNLLTEVDDIEKSILSSRADFKVQQRFEPTLGFEYDYQVNFPVALEAPKSTGYSIQSSKFLYNGKTCTFRNKINTTTIEIVSYGEVVIDNAGSYDYRNGTVSLESFKPTSINGGVDYIKISATPAESTYIQPLRNYILSLDEDELIVSPIQDNQSPKVTI